MRLGAQVVSVASAVVILVGCGSSTPSTTSETSAAPTATDVDGSSMNSAEIEFAQGMIAHHEHCHLFDHFAASLVRVLPGAPQRYVRSFMS